MKKIEQLLQHNHLLPTEDRQACAFRLERMRAWRDQRPLEVTRLECPPIPYIRASLALQTCYQGQAPSERFSPEARGVLMLIPQLDDWKLLEVSPP